MELIPVKVECHAGYKADEYPKSFVWQGVTFEITEILDRWYEAYDQPLSYEVHYFKVKTNMAGSYMLRHVLPPDEWFLVV